MTLNTNIEQLIEQSVMGQISSPSLKQNYRIHPVSGIPLQYPTVGGISYNANLGDPCVGVMADHVEPGVSIKNPSDGANRALNTLACMGNRATVVSGDGKGLIGYVTGKHGGVEHVMIHFPHQPDLDKLVIGDRMQIRAFGTGLQIRTLPELTIMGLSPEVFDQLAQAYQSTDAKFRCPVTHRIPAKLLGAGLGEETCQSGDVDIQLFDEASVEEYNLETLRYGDIVSMEDCDHRYGRIYRQGYRSIGVVTHSCCVQAGHGPGVTTILTGPTSALETVDDPEANLKRFLPI